MSDKAKRATISLGELEVEGFQMPDGSYRMSQTQVAGVIEDDPVYARNFLKSKTLKALRGEGYTPETFEVDPTGQDRGQSRIQGWPLEVVYAYWVYRCFRGSKAAFSIVTALGTETLERRFDAAFGLERSEAERDQRLSQRIQQLDQEVRLLNEAFSTEDLLREENAYLQNQIRQMGGEPWQLPAPEQGDDGE